jgi:hypothetical protein
MKKILKSYLFWTYPRGDFHYDVMVTLILVFIFASPFYINYREHPQPAPASAREVLVRQDGPNAFIYDIASAQLATPPRTAKDPAKDADDPSIRAALLERIQAISGAVQMDRYTIQKDARGRVTSYRVWAHR